MMQYVILCFFYLLSACKHDPPSSGSSVAENQLACTIEVLAAGQDGAGLRFVLRNNSPQVIKLSYFVPVTDFVFQVQADDGPVTLRQPAWNQPVRPQSLALDRGATESLPTPIRLRFGEPAAGAESAMEWRLLHAPARVKLHAELHFSDRGAVPCDGSWGG